MAAIPSTHKTLRYTRLTVRQRWRDWVGETPRGLGFLLVAGVVMLYMVNLREAHFTQMMQLVSGWACVLLLLFIERFTATRRNAWRLVFVLVSAYLTLRYLWWRS